MAAIIVGQSMEEVIATAEEKINDHFAELKKRQGYYAHKILQAHRVLDGKEPSKQLAEEARTRNTMTEDLARTIIQRAEADDEHEMRRVELIQKLRKAKTMARVRTVTDPLGIEL